MVDLIEIVPLDKPVRAEITVPGSKSITNRALILAALANGETRLEGALWSEDTQVMVDALQKLGFEIKVEADPDEFCNRVITVKGLGGKIPNAGTAEKPLEIFVGNAGTAARFLAAFVCLGHGVYKLHGVPRMHERPQAALFQALRELGYRIDSPNDKLPVLIFGDGPRQGKCSVSIEESSQFASALLLVSKAGQWEVETIGSNSEESPYVALTSKLIGVFPHSGGIFQIEPDASSGSYFWAVDSFMRAAEMSKLFSHAVSGGKRVFDDSDFPTRITVAHWPKSGWQIDAEFSRFIFRGDSISPLAPDGTTLPGYMVSLGLPTDVSRETNLGDSIMTLAVLAPLTRQMIRLRDLGRLRLQETERVVALRTELTKCGVKVVEKGDVLTILPPTGELHGAEIETYNDHRMAMCFAVLGLKVPGIKLRNPACVKKTFPNFFQKLAGAPPKGLGATILDGKTGRKLGLDELFAD